MRGDGNWTSYENAKRKKYCGRSRRGKNVLFISGDI